MAISVPIDNSSWHGNTFLNNDNYEKFKKKYKNYDVRVVIHNGTGVFLNMKDDKFSSLVTDWQGVPGTLIIHTGKGGLIRKVTVPFHQPMGLCSSVIFSRVAGLTGDEWDLINDFFYYMGYTTAFISTTTEAVVELAKTKGYEPYMFLQNRRTHNNVTLLFKVLTPCF